jgi:hypothetical protein
MEHYGNIKGVKKSRGTNREAGGPHRYLRNKPKKRMVKKVLR